MNSVEIFKYKLNTIIKIKIMKNLTKTTLFSLLLVSFISCDNDDAVVVNEEEVITTVEVQLVAGGTTITLLSKDLDGDGPNPPVVTVSGALQSNVTYVGSTKFLNELEDPAEDITEEVREDNNGTDHQVFYQLLSSLGTVTYNDLDANGNPIGLNFTLVTGTTSGSGNLTVTLRHLPNKMGAGVVEGSITNAGGSTDAEVMFPLVIN